MPPEMFAQVQEPHSCNQIEAIAEIRHGVSEILGHMRGPLGEPEKGYIYRNNKLWEERQERIEDAKETRKGIKSSALGYVVTCIIAFIGGLIARKMGLL